MRSPVARQHPSLSVKAIFTFFTHQLISTIGVLVIAGFLTGLGFDLVRLLFRKPFPASSLQWVLTGIPYFPVQTIFALLLGWLIQRNFHHRSMLWVWILPFLFLCYAFAFLPGIAPLGLGGRLLHFFGPGCRPTLHCLDQVEFTVPFYIAASYSIGALLAKKLGKHSVQTVTGESAESN